MLLIKKEERRKIKSANAPKKKTSAKGRSPKNDAMYKVLGSGFETNRRKH